MWSGVKAKCRARPELELLEVPGEGTGRGAVRPHEDQVR